MKKFFKKGVLLLSLCFLLIGAIGFACKKNDSKDNNLLLLLLAPHVEQSKTGFFIIVPRGIAE
ncbi:hypothetical protein CH373_04315 [Leptospira perolatii]|uniref:Lipoprotein n=1 Tax=Leptospira perolatii TaxID=2023191 RepID=A0A2M9ZQA6_9LEPT|nr:hypothetical protein [Leptospira perolatii]PJZ68983.1 hypothetical protein CH360_13015 [Leptospira perolatii]PJZ74149.1 hypothetical protein CH373_04315 [Leptospira perolatii]